MRSVSVVEIIFPCASFVTLMDFSYWVGTTQPVMDSAEIVTMISFFMVVLWIEDFQTISCFSRLRK